MTHGDALREIERLETQLRLLRGKLRKQDGRNRCHYCGARCRRTVCPAHSDLVALDPAWAPVSSPKAAT